MKTAKEFNEKYGNFLEEGHYGMAIDLPEIVDFLDKVFEDLVKINGFKYFQIKTKFGYARFYVKGISYEMTYLIEAKLNEILKAYKDEQEYRNENNKTIKS